MPEYGVPVFLGYLAAYSEVFASIALLLGLFTRLDALLLGSVMVFAIKMVHWPEALIAEGEGIARILQMIRAMELPLALLACCLALLLMGGGRYSLDAWLRIEERIANLRRK